MTPKNIWWERGVNLARNKTGRRKTERQRVINVMELVENSWEVSQNTSFHRRLMTIRLGMALQVFIDIYSI